MIFEAPAAFLLQTDLVQMVRETGPAGWVVLSILIVFSIFSWTVIFSKLSALGGARRTNWRFLRAFRKAAALDAVMLASEQYRPSPLVSVFDFGYEEVERQVKSRGRLNNRTALERALQLGVSEEIAKMERNMHCGDQGFGNAGTHGGQQGATSLAAVGPGISEALIATALGLFAAIPAALFYNLFGNRIREMGARLDDFALEFLNLAERSFSE